MIIIAGLVLLPAIVGVLAYKVFELYDHRNGDPTLTAYRKELMHSRIAVQKTREETTRHLNALALKMGSLQAQTLRLNALGSRLTHMAGLDNHEFSFDTPPAVGGPEKSVAAIAAASPDITHDMDILARDIDRSQARLMALESMMIDRKLVAAVTPAGWPVQGGWVSSGFGVRMDPFTGHQGIHEGVDIAARFGGPIFAMGDGLVNFAGEKSGYGMLVEITHESGLVTRYAHCSAIQVKEGDRVERGQQVASIGTTGRSTGPHLHFEVIRDGRPVSPIAYLDSSSRQLASTTTKLATLKQN